jgi:hypothetical protein
VAPLASFSAKSGAVFRLGEFLAEHPTGPWVREQEKKIDVEATTVSAAILTNFTEFPKQSVYREEVC